jgi:hypothetical protein
MRKLTLLISLICSLNSWGQQNYFQQEVNYTISVKLDDRNHFLHGDEKFEYINNSPQSLSYIYVHLWPNAYKNQSTAMAKQLFRDRNYVFFNALRNEKGFIDSLDFKVNGEKVNWKLVDDNIDIGIIYLKEPLAPGKKCTVTTPFRVKLPSGNISRLGHVGQSYQITQWYPKPAVYDAEGWHPMPYLTQGEFYSEYGSFDVSITLPANYIVGATGNLQTKKEIAYLDSLSLLPIRTDKDLKEDSTLASSAQWKTIQYKQRNVHDFGWFADKKWNVRKGEVITPYTKTKVTTWAMFTPQNASLWEKSIEYLHDATYYYSLWNGDYPYTQVTAVDGTISAGGGMEYPNVTVIGNARNEKELETVIMHEVGHNWFYGILGSNERDHAWMDEGINSFNEDRYMITKYGESKGEGNVSIGKLKNAVDLGRLNARDLSQLTYLLTANYDFDQPLKCHSNDYLSINYGANVYKKTAAVFFYLQQYLGEELFDKCMQHYFSEWKFKHPQPKDIQACFEKISGQDLDWFFQSFIESNGKADFSIRSASTKKQSDGAQKVTAKVKNFGSITGPCNVTIVNKEGKTQTTWSQPLAPGKTGRVQFDIKDNVKIEKVIINYDTVIPEISYKNNQYRMRSLLPKNEKLAIRAFTGLPNRERTQLYLLPAVSWNMYDKWMAGLMIHNQHVLNRKWQWMAAPMFSFGQKDLVGIYSASLRWKKFQFGVQGRSFHSGYQTNLLSSNSNTGAYAEKYQWTNEYIKWTSKGDPAQYHKGYKTEVMVNYITVQSDVKSDVELFQVSRKRSFIQSHINTKWKIGTRSAIEYAFHWSRSVDAKNPGSQRITTFNYSYQYHPTKDSRKLQVNFFSGANNNQLLSLWNPAGMTANMDYSFSQYYFGRSETDGILSRQIAPGYGQLNASTNQYFNLRLMSLNTTCRIPADNIPVSVFVSGAAGFQRNTPDLLNVNEGEIKTSYLWSTGLILHAFPGILDVYIPVYVNEPNPNLTTSKGKFNIWKNIMFSMNIPAMNPFEIVSKNIAR